MKIRSVKGIVAGIGVVVAATVIAQERRSPANDQLAAPGTQHQELNALVGNWQATGQCFKESAQGEPVSGTAKSEWILGNRFVHCNAHWTEGGKSVEGMGLTGYDNAEKKFVTAWADTMATGIKSETGDYNPASRTFTFTGDFKNENGQTVHCKKIMKVSSDNEHTITGYITEPGKTETKIVELTFKRSN